MAGGTELHLMSILPRLDRRRFEPRVLVLESNPDWDTRMRDLGIPVIEGSSQVNPVARAAACLPRLLRSQYRGGRPRIVHFFLPEPYLLGGMSSLLVRGIRRVMSRRSLNDYQSAHPLARRLEHRLHRRMDAVLGNSEAVVRQLLAEGVPGDRVGLIYNGVDLRRYGKRDQRERLRTELGIHPEAFVIVQVANLVHYKGHADLLAALAGIRQRLPVSWRLLCVGRDDGLAATLRTQAKRLGLEKNIHWLGERADVPEILGCADLAVSCSHEEGFSNSVLEAMAAGLAVVATCVGGNREAVVDGSTGVLVPAHDVDAIGAAIAGLVADRARLLRLGETGARRVAAQFSLPACVARYERLYESLATAASPPVSAWLDP